MEEEVDERGMAMTGPRGINIEGVPIGRDACGAVAVLLARDSDGSVQSFAALSHASPADQSRDHPVPQDDGLAEDLPTGLDLSGVQ
jgi:hypothetical protein